MKSCSTSDYSDRCRNVDNMLQQFSQDRQKIVTLLEKDPDTLIKTLWTPFSPLCNDGKCLFNMGKTIKHYSLDERINGQIITNEGYINYYMCPQCVNMSRLIDFTKGGLGKRFTLECGKQAGQSLIVMESKINRTYMVKETPPKTVQKLLNSHHMKSLSKCSCSNHDYTCMSYLGLDPFTNNIFINWYLNYQLDCLGIPNLIHMHIAYQCRENGYSLYEYPDIGRIRHLQEYPELLHHCGRPSPTSKADDKTPLSNEVVEGILKQLMATMHALQKYDFSHGGPSSRNILFKNEPCAYMYDGVHIDCPVTIKITDLHNAGITINNIRLYNKSVIADEEIMRKDFKPVIETVEITPFSFDRSAKPEKHTVYKLQDPNKNLKETILFMYIKHLGLPIYQSSFDTYAYMIVLMAERSCYTTVMNNTKLYKFWRNMWLPRDFETIQDRILKLHKTSDPVTQVDKILRVIYGLSLKCNLISTAWEEIKTWT